MSHLSLVKPLPDPLPVPSMEHDLLIDKKLLLHHLARAMEHTNDNDTRYYAMAIVFRITKTGLTIVASNATSLYCVQDLPITQSFLLDATCMLPRPALKPIIKLLKAIPDEEILISLCPEELLCTIHGQSFKLIAGSYPPFEAAIPKPIRISARIDTGKLAKLLTHLKPCTAKNKLIKLVSLYGKVQIEAFKDHQCHAKVDLPILYGSDQLDHIDVNYDLTLLQTCLPKGKNHECEFEWESYQRPLKIRHISDNDGSFFLIVPTRY